MAKNNKKTFMVSIHQDLYKELEKRAKRDKLTVQELINQILWRSAKSSLRHKKRPRKAGKFLEIFSRYKPPHESSAKTYYCNKCNHRHRYGSKIGEKHLEYRER